MVAKRTSIALIALGILVFSAAAGACAAPALHDIRPGYGVTAIGWLSDYHPPLKGTPGDSRVYYLDSGVPGATVYVQGGTHGAEIAGVLAATILVERAIPTVGRLIVVPHANNANVDYKDGSIPDAPSWITVEVEGGAPRSFRYGSRRTNPAYELQPDPEVYVSPSGGQYPGNEMRNLDRVHPGRPDGALTEQIAYAIFRLLVEENVDVAFDLHEAQVTSGIANTLIAHPRAMEAAVLAILDLSMQGLNFSLEQSRDEYRGLSHWEWGNNTRALPFLIETPNPGQTTHLSNRDPVNDPVNPLHHRVGKQLALIRAVLDATALLGMPPMLYEGVPTYADLVRDGLGPWLNAPTARP